MKFNFLNKFFKTKLIKGYPGCHDCPNPDGDCKNPCGCDCGGGGDCSSCGGSGGPGGPCAGCGEGPGGPGGMGGGYAAAGKVSLEDQVDSFFEDSFFEVGQQSSLPVWQRDMIKDAVCNANKGDGKCKGCIGAGVNGGDGVGGCIDIKY